MSGEIQPRSRKRNAKGALKRKEDFKSLRSKDVMNEFDAGDLLLHRDDSSQSRSHERTTTTTHQPVPPAKTRSGKCWKLFFLLILAVFLTVSFVIMFDYKSFKDAEDKPSIRTFVFKSFSEVSAAVSSLVGSLFQNSSREAKYDSEDYPHELNDWIQGKNEDEEQEMEVGQRPAKTVQRPKENPEVKEPKVEQKIVQPLGKKSATEKKGA